MPGLTLGRDRDLDVTAPPEIFILIPRRRPGEGVGNSPHDDQHRWAEAEAAGRVAMASAPASEVDATFAYGLFLLYSGRVREASEYIKRVGQLDHLSLEISTFLQVSLDSAGLPAEAQAESERSKDIPGDHAYGEWMAVMRLWSRQNADMDAVKAQFRRYVDDEGVPLAVDHELLDKLGDKTAALAAIRRAVEDPANQDATRLAVISRYADHFGDKDLAIAALRRVSDLKSSNWYYLL